MAARIQIYRNQQARRYSPGNITADFGPSQATIVRKFHAGFPQYRPTPLLSLDSLATSLGIKRLWVKDESHRFGLNAFKVLGASFAIAHAIADHLAIPPGECTYTRLQESEIRRKIKQLTFVSATDGNHGRAVAWTAAQLGCHSVVYMPHGSAEPRVAAIRSHGAAVDVIDGSYDDAVRRAAGMATANGWILTQDTETDLESNIPLRIMQGYLTMMDEIFDQVGHDIPTHVFVQCGVGSFAAAVLAYLVEKLGSTSLVFVVVEPENAACFYESACNGHPVTVSGHLDTIMAGLACGTPNPAAWKILHTHADLFTACPDEITKTGMRMLANPLGADPKIVSGESGAVTAGMLIHILTENKHKLLELFGLSTDSTVLLISTEGATDPDMYRKIVR